MTGQASDKSSSFLVDNPTKRFEARGNSRMGDLPALAGKSTSAASVRPPGETQARFDAVLLPSLQHLLRWTF